jgi:hypothetical protein
MNKFLLVLALVVACCSSPALAGNVRPRQAHTVDGYPLPYWVYPLPHSERLANSMGGWNRGYPADPYWDPCLSYQRSWGPGACGGR